MGWLHLKLSTLVEARKVDNGRWDALFRRWSGVVPLRCRLCAASIPWGALCNGCRDDLPRAMTMPAQFRDLDGVWACFKYAYPIANLIHDGKYKRDLGSLRLLATLLAELHPRNDAPPDLLVPVPLASDRMKHRGFNQAFELCREVGAQRGVPIATTLVSRRAGDPPQVGLQGAARRRNVRHAFRVNSRIDGAIVVIVDDVMTTGATASSLAASLRVAGAAEVRLWACARAG